MTFHKNLLKATISTLALAISACGGSSSGGNNASPTPTPTPQVPATVTGAAVKGLILNGYVSIEAENATTPGETIGRTDPTTGNFSVEIDGLDPGVVNIRQPLMRVFVTGGPDATMICDAADGCGTVAFGDPVPITENLVLSAIVPVPGDGGTMDVNVNLFTSLVAESIVASNGVDIDMTRQEVADIFGLSSTAIADLPPIDVTDADLDAADAEAQDDVAAALVAAGVLNVAAENPAGFEAGLSSFINGDIVADGVIARESVEDLSVITLEEILQGARSAASSSPDTSAGIALVDAALEDFEDDIALTPPDEPTSGGQLPTDTTAPLVTVSPETASVASGDATVTITSSATDNLGVTSGPVYSCDNNGSIDANGLFTAPVVSAETDVVCTVSYGDLAGNMGSNTFTATVDAETEDPDLTINTATVAIAGGASVGLDFMATDNVGVVSEMVSCTNGVTADGTSITAPFLATQGSSTCTVTVADAAGNEVSDEVAVNIAAETVSPIITITASPARVDVRSGGDPVAAPFTVADNLAVASSTVTCANPRVTVDGMLLSADPVATNFGTTCTVNAADTAGNTATPETFIAIVLKETTAPAITVAASVAAESSEVVALPFTLEDNLTAVGDITSSVSCTGGVTFDAGNITAPSFTEVPAVLPICTITATDEAGNSSSEDVTVNLRLETELPVVDLSSAAGVTVNSGVAEITAVSGQTINLVIPATDNVAVASTELSCATGATVSANVITLEPSATQATIPCTATATDTSGNVSIPVDLNIIATPEQTAPVITFDPASLTLSTVGSVPLMFTVEDSSAINDITVACDDDITYDDTTEVITAPVPAVTSDLVSKCTVTATDAAGNVGTADIPVTVALDSMAPTLDVTVTPASGELTSASPLNVVIDANDDTGVVSTTVTCDDSRLSFNEMDSQIVVAPATFATFMATCTFVVADAAGNTASQNVPVSVSPPPVLPIVHFADDNGVALLPLSGTAAGVTTCTNGGSVDINGVFTNSSATATQSVCTVTLADGSMEEFTVEVGADAADFITLSGNVTYDFVPHGTTQFANGLNYANTTQRAVRSAIVTIVDQNQEAVAATLTDDTGNYSVRVRPNTQAQVLVSAAIQIGPDLENSKARIRVVDNNNGTTSASDPEYSLAGALQPIGAADQTRDLNAASGWDTGTNTYSATRAAAPFAILDTMHSTTEAYLNIDSSLEFTDLVVGWSPNNAGKSFYFRAAGGVPTVTIVGLADVDTDEYDRHVVAHEWGHYYEDQISRSDSVGGAHSLGDKLDPRVAWSEGFANALSGIVLGDSVYRDALGAGQFNGFEIDVDENTNENAGWFSEGSVQSIVYDVFDNDDDGETIALGLSPIHDVMTATAFVEQPTVSTVFSFLAQLRAENSSSAAAITQLALAQSIHGTGYQGTGETNDGGVATSLPLYRTLTLDGPTAEFCSSNDAKEFTLPGERVELGEENRLGNYSFGLIDLPTPTIQDAYRYTYANASGNTMSNIRFLVGELNGFFVQLINGPANNFTSSFGVFGDHTVRIEFASEGNLDNVDNIFTSGNTCYDVSVSAN